MKVEDFDHQDASDEDEKKLEDLLSKMSTLKNH